VSSTAAVKLEREAMGQTLRECPVCGSSHLEYKFVVDRAPVCSCDECGLLFLNPQLGTSTASEPEAGPDSAMLGGIYEANAAERIERLMSYSGLGTGSLLIVGGDKYFPAAAKKAGFDVTAVGAREFESVSERELPEPVDACVLFCALERMNDPLEALGKIRRILKSEGALMTISPTTDSRAARLFGTSWWEFNRANRFYFSVDTLQNLLIKAGFGDPLIEPDHSLVSLNYLRRRLAQSPRSMRRYRLLRGLASLSPVFRNRKFRLVHGRTRFFARPTRRSATPVLSVIVPVYNERATVAELLDQVLAKNIEGVEIETVVVESNSTDGSREIVRQYEDHPRVRVILEDRPRGKGFAVRTALLASRGDVVLFQDADLEYDVNDYDALIAPILRHKCNFVLGSRHTETNSAWKIRTFVDSPALSAYFNFGHALLLAMFNTVYSQKLTDPFTMFKVFRRECLYGLRWECDRFDFDNEIVIKFIRKGYKPVELPVNYVSRSIQEGKKVTLFLDPLRWIRALLKFRKSPLYER